MGEPNLLRFLELRVDYVFARLRRFGLAFGMRARGAVSGRAGFGSRRALIEQLGHLVTGLLKAIDRGFDLRYRAVFAYFLEIGQRGLDFAASAFIEFLADFLERFLGRVDQARSLIADLGLFAFGLVARSRSFGVAHHAIRLPLC